MSENDYIERQIYTGIIGDDNFLKLMEDDDWCRHGLHNRFWAYESNRPFRGEDASQTSWPSKTAARNC